ncbi:MAG TPA: hypothetical protein ENO18_06970 [Caldithrix sp.]|nr:hypothetical protein [Caldithrix sp.]
MTWYPNVKNFKVFEVMLNLDGKANYLTRDGFDKFSSETCYKAKNKTIAQGAEAYKGVLPKVNLYDTKWQIYSDCMKKGALEMITYEREEFSPNMTGTVVGIYRCELDEYVGELKIEMYVDPSDYLKKYDGGCSVALFYKELNISIGKATITGGNL